MVTRRLLVLLGIGLALLAVACTVDVSEEDLLRRRWRCDGDGDCADGWACRSFALDGSGQRYCVHPCDGDDDCLAGELCGAERFCAATCDASGDDGCRDVGFSCLRLSLQSGRSAGICHPDPVCDTSADCYDAPQCLTDVVAGLLPNAPVEAQASACVASCSGAACDPGSTCLRDLLSEFVEDEALVPPICVPACGEDDACPAGFRCVLDALEELYPDAAFDEATYRFCFAGLPGSFLPCTRDTDCLVGRCVTHPTTGLSGGRPYNVCALPCDTGDTCDSARTVCRDVSLDGETAPYCVPRIDLQPCTAPTDCTGGKECQDFSQLIDTWACAEPCTGARDPACPAGTVCTPTAGAAGWGCFPGLPGFPCDRDDQCVNDGGEGTTCRGTGGTGADADRTCTKACTDSADCQFGASQSAATLCHAGICQPLGFDCGDPGVPYECNPTMDCAILLPSAADPVHVCSVPCGDGEPRPAGHLCPRGYGCSPLPQQGLGQVAYYCAPGYPPLMPCRQDTECMSPTGDVGTCASITGAPLASDGTCTMTCLQDADCVLGESQTVISFFCFPGDADAAHPGQCFVSPALDELVNERPGLQGARCVDAADCATGYSCVSPLWKQVVVSDPSRKYCARDCVGQGDCDVEPFAHECVGLTGRHCAPAPPVVSGRDFWAPCQDHRQCRYAFCYLAPEATVGRCTAPCSTAADCPAGDFPDATCSQAEHACLPQL